MATRRGIPRAPPGQGNPDLPPLDEIQAADPVFPRGVKHSVAQRLQALALAEYGVDKKVAAAIAGLSTANGGLSVKRLMEKARRNGFNPSVSSVLKEEYVADTLRSGRPKIATLEKEAEILVSSKLFPASSACLLINLVRQDRNSREKPSSVLGFENGVSSSTILRVLRRNKMRCVKTTKKPGLTAAIMEARFQWALQYKDWTVEDWKKVIWTDETSVCLGQRRGKVRIWRTPSERYHKTCSRRRWKGFMEFMFWGCFSYDKKRAMPRMGVRNSS